MENYRLNVGPGAIATVFKDVEKILLPDGVRLVMPVQTHTVNVGVVGGDGGDGDVNVEETVAFPETDALVTSRRRVAVGVRTADCVPIVLNASDIHCVAAVHAGWKGTVGHIVVNAVRKMIEMGADPVGIHAAFGPCICGECYEVSRELAGRFEDAGLGDAVVRGVGSDPLGEKTFSSDSVRINLESANVMQLLQCGVRMENIALSEVCTRHSAGGWPSWRRDCGTARRLACVIYAE